jgi:hypothetical protein
MFNKAMFIMANTLFIVISLCYSNDDIMSNGYRLQMMAPELPQFYHL